MAKLIVASLVVIMTTVASGRTAPGVIPQEESKWLDIKAGIFTRGSVNLP